MANNKVILGDETIMDITDTTATTESVLDGEVFYGADGVRRVGKAKSGSTDYEELINKPQINHVELVGDKTLADLGIKYVWSGTHAEYAEIYSELPNECVVIFKDDNDEFDSIPAFMGTKEEFLEVVDMLADGTGVDITDDEEDVIEYDASLSPTSMNAVQNRVIKQEFDKIYSKPIITKDESGEAQSASTDMRYWEEKDGKKVVAIYVTNPSTYGQNIGRLPSEFTSGSHLIPLIGASNGTEMFGGSAIIRESGLVQYYGQISPNHTLPLSGMLQFYN